MNRFEETMADAQAFFLNKNEKLWVEDRRHIFFYHIICAFPNIVFRFEYIPSIQY